MKDLTLEDLGLDAEALTARLVDRIAEKYMTALHYDEDGEEWVGDSKVAKSLNDMAKKRLDELVNEIGEKHVLPRVSEMVEGLVLQQTNAWGEKLGQPVTFIEYMTQRADAWLREEVNFEGKTKAENGGYSWSKRGTRVQFLIDKHLYIAVERAMTEAVKSANQSIVGGLQEAVKIALAEVSGKLKVEVKTK